ncbi:hypothetical protein [Bradyrhizobium iriomotense]|uniref:hypothetical protein n=1 Tax=Bradyrhizobium iriomotense TaxID=441950 RepID=UPI0024E0B78B|nr:hypothetical protein [Bradyrhizobium iriomotense]
MQVCVRSRSACWLRGNPTTSAQNVLAVSIDLGQKLLIRVGSTDSARSILRPKTLDAIQHLATDETWIERVASEHVLLQPDFRWSSPLKRHAAKRNFADALAKDDITENDPQPDHIEQFRTSESARPTFNADCCWRSFCRSVGRFIDLHGGRLPGRQRRSEVGPSGGSCRGKSA